MPFLAFISVFWIICTGFGYLTSQPDSAPQQAAGAAMAMVGMIFPYVIYRISQGQAVLRQQAEIIRLLKGDAAEPAKPKPKQYWWKKPVP